MALEWSTRYFWDRTSSGTIEFKFVSYGTNITTGSVNLIGLTTLNVDFVNVVDLLVAESDRSTVDTYTDLGTCQKIYYAY